MANLFPRVNVVLRAMCWTCFMLTFWLSTSLLASEVPHGHLKPFGGHRSPDSVDEMHGFPSAHDFMQTYVQHRKPLVLRGAAKNFPAFNIWHEDFMKANYADLEVRLEAKKETQGYIPVGEAGVGRDTISHFIDTYHKTDRYIVSELPTPMWKDVGVFPCMSCGPFVEKFVEIDIWMSGGNTSSLIHKDAYNTINCLVNGTKEWKLVAFEHQDKIYQFQEETEGIGGFSRINASSVDLYKYPRVSELPWSYTVLEKGDCLYLPGSVWHQVQSHGEMNVAVAFLFSRFDDKTFTREDFADCHDRKERYVPLNEVDVDWQYSGKGEMTMGVFDFESGWESVGEIFARDGQFSVKHAARYFKLSWGGGTPKQLKEKVLGLMRLLRKWTDSGRPTNITLEATQKIGRQGQREILHHIHPVIPENTYMFEYYYIHENEIHLAMKTILEQDGVLNRETFLVQYVKMCGGTRKFASEIFQRLQPDAADVKDDLTEAEVKSRLVYATFKFKRGNEGETGFVFADNEEEMFKKPSDYAIDDAAWKDVGEMDEETAQRGGGGSEDEHSSDAYEGKIIREELAALDPGFESQPGRVEL